MSLDFLKWITLSFCCFICTQFFTQSEPLKSSIGFTQNLRQSAPDTKITLDSVGYPADLLASKIFYIEINNSDLYGNQPGLSRSYKGINRKVARAMKKKLVKDFEIFSNSKIMEEKDFFKSKGCKYRLLLRSSWVTKFTLQMDQEFVWMYSVAVQDISTGRIYGNEALQYRPSFFQHFFDILSGKEEVSTLPRKLSLN